MIQTPPTPGSASAISSEEDGEEGGEGWTQYWRMPEAAAWTMRQLLLTAGLGTAREGLA